MILGVIDHNGGLMNASSLEMLTLARGLTRGAANEGNNSVEAILIGEEAGPLAEQLPAYGVSRVHLVQHPGLSEYAPEAWARSVVQLMESLSPQAVMAPGTERGNEVMAHVAALTDLPMAANCVDVRFDNGYALVTRLRWGGSLLEEARLEGEPKVLTVAPFTITAEEAPAPAAFTVETFTPTLDDKAFRVRVTGRVEAAGDKISLAEARAVVGGGRGVGSAEGFALLEELAGLLGGVVGGSRVATNLGWRPHADQIGQTGTRITPDLYIACGISGAIQHMVGCKGAKHILAINVDREAPLVTRADYAIIGNLHEIVPALIEEIKKVKAA